jgi:hypothetical protein
MAEKTSNVDADKGGDETRKMKRTKDDSKEREDDMDPSKEVDRKAGTGYFFPEDSDDDDDTLLSSTEGNNSNNSNAGRWTTNEHSQFLVALEAYGHDWRRIALDIKTRNNIQVRVS